MRILFTKRTFGPMGGSESLAYQFAKRLADRGHDVRVVCGQSFDDRPRYPPRRVEDGVEVLRVKPRGGFLGTIADASGFFDLLPTDELRRHAEDRDLIHNVGREYLDSSLAVGAELDLPVVLTPLAHVGQFHGGDAPEDFERYRRASAITTMTDWERSWYTQHGIDPYRVVTTGMGPNSARSRDGAAFRARNGIPLGVPIVLYIGRRERYKGFVHLLDAAELVWRTHPDARFVFIGMRGYYGAVVDEFARYTDERIVEIENASAAERSAALDACDVCAIPSQHETFGLVYLEAWLHEKPVIGGDIPAVREVIAHGKDGLVVPQRVNDIASAISALLADAELRARMGRAGAAKIAERWEWDRVMDRVETAYERALEAYAPAGEALA
jgi:glycosyltransferase involved in cell wall biosynthesis